MPKFIKKVSPSLCRNVSRNYGRLPSKIRNPLLTARINRSLTVRRSSRLKIMAFWRPLPRSTGGVRSLCPVWPGRWALEAIEPDRYYCFTTSNTLISFIGNLSRTSLRVLLCVGLVQRSCEHYQGAVPVDLHEHSLALLF